VHARFAPSDGIRLLRPSNSAAGGSKGQTTYQVFHLGFAYGFADTWSN
jgi:hypothetical protein